VCHFIKRFPDKKFDIVLCVLAIHHIDNSDIYCIFDKLLSESGILIIIDHNIISETDRQLTTSHHMLVREFYEENDNQIENNIQYLSIFYIIKNMRVCDFRLEYLEFFKNDILNQYISLWKRRKK
jgi:2-polyprenyl-3-methyl-5-hydroxy-6-metoxy-1,4-benzoquinol methylase